MPETATQAVCSALGKWEREEPQQARTKRPSAVLPSIGAPTSPPQLTVGLARMLLILARRNLPRYQARSMMPYVRRGLSDADRSMVELAHDPRSLRWDTCPGFGAST